MSEKIPIASLAANRLLRQLPADLASRMRPDFELVNGRNGQLVIEVGNVIEYLYFPTTCLLSNIVTLQNGVSVESNTVGSEGFSGTPVLLGETVATENTLVQVPGEVLRI